MMNETMETTMEMENNVNVDEVEVYEGTVEGAGSKSDKGGLTPLLVGGALALGAGAVALYHKVKETKKDKEEKPTKQKTKLKLFARVPVEDEPVEDVEPEVEKVDGEVVETKATKKK